MKKPSCGAQNRDPGASGRRIARLAFFAMTAAFAALVGSTFGAEPWIKMTADKATAAQPDFRLIWVVDPVAWLAPDAACQGKAVSGPVRRAERVEMRAYFCSEQRTLSAVQGSVKRPAGSDDAHWQQLVRQMSRQLVGNRVSG